MQNKLVAVQSATTRFSLSGALGQSIVRLHYAFLDLSPTA